MNCETKVSVQATVNVGYQGTMSYAPYTDMFSSTETFYPHLPVNSEASKPEMVYHQPNTQPYYQPSTQSYYFPKPQPVLTHAKHQQTMALIYRAQGIVTSILPQPKPPAYNPHMGAPVYTKTKAAPAVSAAPVVVNITDKSIKMFNNETTQVHHHHHGGQQQQKNDDTAGRWLAGIVGLIVVLGGAFLLGKAVTENEEQQEDIADFSVLKDQWSTNKVLYETDYQTSVESIVRHVENITGRKHTNKTHTIVLLFFGIAAGGSLVAGAVLAIQALIAAGLIVGTVVGGVAVYKVARHLFSSRDEKEAREIEKQIFYVNNNQPVVYA